MLLAVGGWEGVVTMAVTRVAGLHGVDKTNVVSYGGTLARTGNSVSGTVRVVHGGKRTITTGHSSHRTSRNYILTGGSNRFTTVVTLGYRASFITGGTSFMTLARTVLSTTITGEYGALRRMGTLPVNGNAMRSTMASHDNVANRGVRLSNCGIIRNTCASVCGRRKGGRLYAVITVGGRTRTTTRKITVRVTTVGPVTVSRTNIPRSMGRTRVRMTVSGAGGRRMSGTIRITLGGTNVGPTRMSDRRRVRDGGTGN